MSSRPATKFVTVAVIAVIVSLVACFALYVWQQSRVPERGGIAAIERRYGKQLKLLTDYAYDYECVHGSVLDSEKIKRLFGDAAIVEAAVYGSNSLNRGGIGIKPSTTSRVGTSCWFQRSPSLGKPVVNLWRGNGQQFVECSAALLDRKGVERSYTIIFDLSKMDAAKD